MNIGPNKDLSLSPWPTISTDAAVEVSHNHHYEEQAHPHVPYGMWDTGMWENKARDSSMWARYLVM